MGRKVNPTVYTAAEFSTRARKKNTFVTRLIKQPKLWVMGSEHDLRRMAELVKYSGTFINRFPANDEIEAIDARRDRDLNARPRR